MATEDEDTNPVTLDEWQAYVDGITTDEELYEVAMAAGTLAFGQKLLAEGFLAEDVTVIRTMLAQRLLLEEIAPPTRVGGCVIDYRALLPPGSFAY